MVVSLLIGASVSYLIGVIILVTARPVHRDALVQSLVLLIVLTGLGAVNLRFGIIEQKFASEFAFDRFRGEESLRPNDTFAVQAIANTPAFIVAQGWQAAIGTNAAVTALVYAFLWDRGSKAHLYSLGPAAFNFSFFALRDPFIGLIFMFLVLAFGRDFNLKKLPVPLLIAAVAMFWTRPENLLIILSLVGVLAYRHSNTVLTRFAVLGLGVVSAIIALRFAPALLGVRTTISIGNLPAFFAEFSEDRGTRTEATGVGGGSDILGGALQRMPLPIRYPIQLFTFFVLPLPFEIRSVTLLLSAVDSVFFAYSSRKLFKEGTAPAKLLFVVYVLVAAFFSSNYGNVFRIRYPLYFVIGAGLYANRGATPSTSPAGRALRRESGTVVREGLHQ